MPSRRADERPDLRRGKPLVQFLDGVGRFVMRGLEQCAAGIELPDLGGAHRLSLGQIRVAWNFPML
jgi:hypothetical protein